MQTLRQQAHIELEDLSLDFHLEVIRTWGESGIDAARCYALGA